MTRAEASRRLAVGIAQIVLATATLGAWIGRAPGAVVVALALATGVLVLMSLVRWHGR
jgi:hypothetical protein